LLYFFFSSRRRHTRLQGDWSSDVCSSDLDREAAWDVTELAYWRRQAGLRDELPRTLTRTPYLLAIDGDWAGAAEGWRALGCPYEAALALADGGDLEVAGQAVDELQRLGAGPAAARLAGQL